MVALASSFYQLEQAEAYGQCVQQAFQQKTGGGASVTYVIEPLPEHIQNVDDVTDLTETFQLIQLHLQEQKLHPPE